MKSKDRPARQPKRRPRDFREQLADVTEAKPTLPESTVEPWDVEVYRSIFGCWPWEKAE